MNYPVRPFVAIVGGARVSDKIVMLDRLTGGVGTLLIGSSMANPFLKTEGYEVGDSLVENDQLTVARSVLAKVQPRRFSLLLPLDLIITDRFSSDVSFKTVLVDRVSPGWRTLDVGPQTIVAFREAHLECVPSYRPRRPAETSALQRDPADLHLPLRQPHAC